ncbi:hypothetical protein TraAM80_05615 [Trypanosoma rangeli]|uniref:Uncharacterized protein n=1 Tax=Trypanosoma rangeli TaxID=5698 RepID=A0A3R7KY00_TRYRA|nr:uncharacterized protein TraAM80_05615 [Trypanosoma rangeli]RNF03557.1 hypothetical protein TraAM80_05615 [Trypanosoma rangeli]|eukprot:RNF03557.1 hypothetical protein TraAM80_05615 [Trypanosoma rangeli]
MHGSGGTVFSPHDGSFVYTSPIVASQRRSRRGDGLAASGAPAGPQPNKQDWPRKSNRGKEEAEFEEETPTSPWQPSGLLPAASASPKTASPAKHGRLLLMSPQKDRSDVFTLSRRLPDTSFVSAATMAVVSCTASTGHQYNIPLEGASLFRQQVVDTFKRRGPLAASAEGLGAVRDEAFPWTEQMPLETKGASSTPMKSPEERRSHRSVITSKAGATNETESVVRKQAMYIIGTALETTLSPGVKPVGHVGSTRVGDDDEITCVALSYSFEAELRGRLLVEHVALWLKEDVSRQKLYMCEDHARRTLLMQVMITLQVEQNKRQHAARMREFESHVAQLAEEERDTLTVSIRNLGKEEAELLQRVHRMEQQVTWNQQKLFMQEQETQTHIKMERHARVDQLRQLELRLEEALERRKQVVLDNAYGHNQDPIFFSALPRCRKHHGGVEKTDCGLRCTLRDTNFSEYNYRGGLREHTTDSAPAGNVPVVAANDAVASCRDVAASSARFLSLPTATLGSTSFPVSPNTDSKRAFTTVMRETMAAATALLQKEFSP